MKSYAAVARAVFARPWAILPETLEVIAQIVAERLVAGTGPDDAVVAARLEAAALTAGPRGGGQRTGAVAVIPLYGVIAPRMGSMSEMSGGTSVERFRGNLRDALGDDRVSAILIDCDSPGGVVDGVPEIADELRAARGQKPIVAIANTMMASAAYWIGCAAQEVWASPSAQVGSIGVITRHQDVSKAAEQAGVKVTTISAGKYKGEAGQFEPLTDEARAAIQDLVDQTYGMFTSAVAKSRGVPVATVRDGYGQGRVVTARDALASGMIDSVGTFDQALQQASWLGAGTASSSGGSARNALQLMSVEDVLEFHAGVVPDGAIVIAEGGERFEAGASVPVGEPTDDPAKPDPESPDDPVATSSDDGTADDAKAELELERALAEADADRRPAA